MRHNRVLIETVLKHCKAVLVLFDTAKLLTRVFYFGAYDTLKYAVLNPCCHLLLPD